MKKLRTGKISKPRPALEDVFAFATMMQRQKSMSENRGEMIAEGLLGVVRPLTPNTRNAAVASLEKGLRNMHVRNKSSLGKVVKADEYYEEEKEGEALPLDPMEEDPPATEADRKRASDLALLRRKKKSAKPCRRI